MSTEKKMKNDTITNCSAFVANIEKIKTAIIYPFSVENSVAFAGGGGCKCHCNCNCQCEKGM